MQLLLAGLSHQAAPVDVRAAVAVRVGDPASWCAARSTLRPASVEGILLLATCHRFECYLAASNREEALAAMSDWFGANISAPSPSPWMVREGFDAALHLARVACGLESLIVGEAEVAGQVRRSAALARENGVFGPYLERVLSGALAASGRARSETGIAEGVRSAASAAVALAAGRLGDLSQRNILIIGAGQAARTVLSRLSRHRARRVSIASRSRHHACAAAAETGAAVWSLEEMAGRLADVDVVIAATTANTPLLTAADLSAAIVAEPRRRRLLIDLSVPRVIELLVTELPGVELRSVDDLGDIADQSVIRRQREIPRVEAIARDEAARAMSRFEERAEWDRASASRQP